MEKHDIDKYDDVTLQIINIIKKNFSADSDSKHIYDDIRKNIDDVLKNNFNIEYEYLGRKLAEDIRLFDYESGYEFVVPLFSAPLFIIKGVKLIDNNIFPNYDIENKYIGYTERGIFYKIDDFTLFMRHMKKRPLTVIASFILIYMIIYIIIKSLFE